MYVRRSGYFNVATQKEFQESVIKNLEKLENSVNAVNAKIDALNNDKIRSLELQVARLETRLLMVVGVLGPIGATGLGLALKALFK